MCVNLNMNIINTEYIMLNRTINKSICASLQFGDNGTITTDNTKEKISKVTKFIHISMKGNNRCDAEIKTSINSVNISVGTIYDNSGADIFRKNVPNPNNNESIMENKR